MSDKKPDWTGNRHSIFKTLGASNHVEEEREKRDYYATDPKAAELLMEVETFKNPIWEPACGEGHLSKKFEEAGYKVISTDIFYRGFGEEEPFDFLEETRENFKGDIITNPPYKFALQFVEKALNTVETGRKVAMFLKIQFLEGKARREFYKDNPPKTVYVLSSRLLCAKNGEFDQYSSSAVAYAWFVWEKGFKGDPAIKWIN